jgi:hypothetical protein
MKTREVEFKNVPLYQPFLSITKNNRLIKISDTNVIDISNGNRVCTWSQGQIVILDLPIIGEKYVYKRDASDSKKECTVVGYMPQDINCVIIELEYDTIVASVHQLTDASKRLMYSDLEPGQKFKFKNDDVVCTKLICFENGKDMYSWGTRVSFLHYPTEVILVEEED